MFLPSVAIDFIYDNEKLSDYDMMLCEFDNSSSKTVSVGSNITFNTVKTNGSDRNYYVSYSYDQPLTTTFQICKKDCIGNDKYITSEEETSILRWLCRKDGFHKFEICQDGYKNTYFMGSFNEPNKIKVGGLTVGLEFTLVTDSPYGYEDITFDFTTTASIGYSIFNLSTETGHLYPVEFNCKCLESGDLQIHNSIEDRTTEIKNCVKDEVITLDGNHKIIETSVPTHKIYNDFNYNYFRLGNTYDNNLNTITTSLPCEIHIKYASVRKVGIG